MRAPLPIDPFLPRILEGLARARAVIVVAEPGAGKSTRIPEALLAGGSRLGVAVLEPRRVAAKLLAGFVAEGRGEKPGLSVGYRFRFENVTGPKTKLSFLTEGTFLRDLIADPMLSRWGVICLDEFHERSLQTDTALAATLECMRGQRSDLKLVVMSATMDADRVRAHLEKSLGPNSTESFFVPGSRYSLKTLYTDSPTGAGALARGRAATLETRVLRGVERALELAPEGDVLVFLPGAPEIHRAADEAQARWGPQLAIHKLFGEQPKEEQERALGRDPSGRRKILFATNIAESSVTIDGVRAVVDSGLVRQASFSWWSGIPHLSTKFASQASVIQRAGRAARQAAGVCVRLFSEAEWSAMAPYDPPEITRSDLCQLMLELYATFGYDETRALPWFESPPASAVGHADELLRNLGALDSDGRITGLGRSMAEIPAPPRLARVLVEARLQKIADEAADFCAALTEERARTLDALSVQPFSWRAKRAAAQFRQALGSLPSMPPPRFEASSLAAADRLAFCVATGFLDRVALRRGEGQNVELVLAQGGTASVEHSPVLASSKLFLVLDVTERKRGITTELLVRSLVPIQEEWLWEIASDRMTEEIDFEWDRSAERLRVSSRIRFGQIVLEDRPLQGALPEAHLARARVELGRAIERHGVAAVIDDPERWARFWGRAALWHSYRGETDPGCSWERLLVEYAPDARSFREVREAKLMEQLEAGELARKMNRDLPLELTAPSGRRVRLHYEPGKAPWAESRIQDFFGWTSNPKIMGGSLSVVLHLLAPNHRAVQVTSDLLGFWERDYPRVRAELSRRYPRHKWPEDPRKPLS